MPATQSPWYGRYAKKPRGFGRDNNVKPKYPSPGVGVGQRGTNWGPRGTIDGQGPASQVSTEWSYSYLLDSLRTNAPGFSDQDAMSLTRSGYTGISWLAINAFSTQAGQAEMTLYEEDEEDPDKHIPLSRHEDAVRLLRDPNPDDTFGIVLKQLAIQYWLTGSALLWCPRDEPDEPPRDMYVLSTASVLPQPISPRYPEGAWLVQPWYPAGPFSQVPTSRGVGSVVPADEVIMLKAVHPFFRWTGFAALWAISMQQDVSRMIDTARLNTFTQGIDPSAILSFDPAVNQPDDAMIRRLQASLQAVWGGPANAGRVAVVPGGAELSRLSNAPLDMGYQEGWDQLLSFTLCALGVNKAIVGMTDSFNFATMIGAYRGFRLCSLDPWLSEAAALIAKKLLRKHFDPHFGMTLEGKDITDDSVRGQDEQRGIQGNFYRVGELRKAHKLKPSDRDEEWVGGDPQQQQGGPGGAGGEEQPGAGSGLESLLGMAGGDGAGQRPEAGTGSPSDAGTQRGMKRRLERQAERLDRAMSRGRARPVRKSDLVEV